MELHWSIAVFNLDIAIEVLKFYVLGRGSQAKWPGQRTGMEAARFHVEVAFELAKLHIRAIAFEADLLSDAGQFRSIPVASIESHQAGHIRDVGSKHASA